MEKRLDEWGRQHPVLSMAIAAGSVIIGLPVILAGLWLISIL